MELAIGLGSGQTPSNRTGIDAMIDAAQTAEGLGFDALMAPDHYVYESMGALQPDTPAYELFVVLATLRRREATHGLSLLCINFSSLEHTRQFGEQVLPLLRTRGA